MACGDNLQIRRRQLTAQSTHGFGATEATGGCDKSWIVVCTVQRAPASPAIRLELEANVPLERPSALTLSADLEQISFTRSRSCFETPK